MSSPIWYSVFLPLGFLETAAMRLAHSNIWGGDIFKVFISRTFTYPNCQHARKTEGKPKGNACLVAFNCSCLKGAEARVGMLLLPLGINVLHTSFDSRVVLSASGSPMPQQHLVSTPLAVYLLFSPFSLSIFCLICHLIAGTVGTIKKLRCPFGKGIRILYENRSVAW